MSRLIEFSRLPQQTLNCRHPRGLNKLKQCHQKVKLTWTVLNSDARVKADTVKTGNAMSIFTEDYLQNNVSSRLKHHPNVWMSVCGCPALRATTLSSRELSSSSWGNCTFLPKGSQQDRRQLRGTQGGMLGGEVANQGAYATYYSHQEEKGSFYNLWFP